MAEDELSPLDKLMLAVSAPDPLKNTPKQDEQNSTLNEDEFFLAQIAANDLKVLVKPPKQQLKKLDLSLPSTSRNKSPSKSPTNKLSLIHSGDTDSSDDESNRHPENVNLNEYGKQIKHLLPEIKDREFQEVISKSWKPKRDTPSAKAIPPLKFGLPPVQKTPKSDENVLQDPFFGIRISKPLISSAMLEERMNGRAAVSMFRVKNFIAQNGQTQDWVIAGCIVQKSNARTSQSGNQYIIWTLSDLHNDLQSVSLFLFKNAYKELWKTSIGTVVGVLNPSILDNREGSRHQATLSVDNSQRVMVFGQSKDYGLCKSRKKDGEPCTAFVNVNRCSYCLYHVKQEYQKCSLRSDCQSIGGGLTALRNKVLGKNEVFYAGKSYMAIPARKNKRLVERDSKRLSDLMNNGLVTSAVPTQRKKKAVASSLEVSRAQRFKDLQLLQKLNGSSDVLTGLESRTNCDLDDISAEVTLEESRQTALDVIAKLKAKNNLNVGPSAPTLKLSDPSTSTLKLSDPSTSTIELSDTSSSTIKLNNPPPSAITLSDPSSSNVKLNDPLSKAPEPNKPKKPSEIAKSNLIDTTKLKILKDLHAAPAPKLSQNAVIDLNFPLRNRAKLKALNWIQKNGPINKTNPSGAQKSGVKRFLENAEAPAETKKSKLSENAQISDRFRKIMELTSAHADLLEQRDRDEQDKYFAKLEQREKMEEKMMSTYKVQCKAVKCLVCKYTSFSAAAKCKEEKHALKVYDAIKRFFKCGNCGSRTVSLDVYPTFNCKNCSGTKWERSTMMKEKIVQIGDGLSIRGGEQKFVASVVSDANINLLVPDD